MNSIFHAALLVIVVTLVSLGGLALARKLISKNLIEINDSAAEAMLGVVGTLFSVLLGFMVAGAMDKYHDARMHAEQEANAVASVFRLARGLSDIDRPRVRDLCRGYVNEILQVEWKMMEEKRAINHGWEAYQKLWESVVAVSPENDRQNSLLQELAGQMTQVGEHRRSRILISQDAPSGALWIVIVAGGVITVVFTYVFASHFPGVQDLMTGLVAAALALNVWLFSAYSSPFSGELAIKPTMFSLMKENVLVVPDTPSRYLHDAAK